MAHNWLQAVLHGLTHASHRESVKGNKGRGTGLACIALGLFLLWVPIIGVPLIVLGLVLCVAG